MSDVRAALDAALEGGPERHRKKVAEQEKLPVRERVARLLDPDTLAEEGLLANWEQEGLGADGVVTGLATISTILNDRLHFHWNRLIEDINPARPAVQQFLEAQTSRLDGLVPGDSSRAAFKLLANLVRREALVLTYNDVLMLLGVAFVIGLLIMPLVGRPQSRMAH